jgi:thermitase
VAALVVSANQNLSGSQVQSILKQTSDDRGTTGWDTTFGWGRVNAARAVESALGSGVDNTAPTLNINSPSPGIVVSGTATVDVAASDNVAVSSVTFSVDGVDKLTLASAPYTFNWDTITVSNGPHILAATARDAAGNQSGRTVSVIVDNRPESAPPQVAIISPTNGANVNGAVSVLVNATGGLPIIRVELYVDGVLKSSSAIAPFTTKWVAKKEAAGAHSIQCKAYDMEGRVAVSTVVTVYR